VEFSCVFEVTDVDLKLYLAFAGKSSYG